MSEYVAVRERIAECFRIARAEGALRKSADGLDDADEVLDDPSIAVLAKDQTVGNDEVGAAYREWFQAKCAELGFRRIVEKPEEKRR